MNAPSKILSHGDGLGDIDLTLVETRAEEIAKSDGRDSPNESDMETALEELSGLEDHQAPEVVPGTEAMTEWDESPKEHGVHAPNLGLEDERNNVEELFLQGAEEADHEIRVVSADNSWEAEEQEDQD